MGQVACRSEYHGGRLSLQDDIHFVENDAVLKVVLATSHSLGAVVEAARRVANPDMERWLCFNSMGESLELFHHGDDARQIGVENNGHTDLCGSYLLIAALGITKDPNG